MLLTAGKNQHCRSSRKTYANLSMLSGIPQCFKICISTVPFAVERCQYPGVGGGFFDGLSNIFYRIDPDNAAAGFIAHGVDEFVPRIFFAGFFDRLYQLVDQILPRAETDQIRARCGHLLYSVSCGKPKTNSAIPPCGRNAGAI